MNRAMLRRFLVFLLIFFVARFAAIGGLNAWSTWATGTLEVDKGSVEIDASPDCICALRGLEASGDGVSFHYSVKNGKEAAVLLDGLAYHHSIYDGEELLSQNIDQGLPSYDGRYASKTFNLQGDGNFTVKGAGAGLTGIYVSGVEGIKHSVEIRSFFYSAMLMLLLVFTLATGFFYFRNRGNMYFLVFMAMGALSIAKAVNFGEVYPLANVFPLNFGAIAAIDRIVMIICGFLPIYVMVHIYDIETGKKPKLALLAYIVLLCLSAVMPAISGRAVKLAYLAVLIPMDLAANSYGFMRGKKYSTCILLNNVVFSSLANYQSMVDYGVLRGGAFSVVADFSFLGLIIYLYVFLAVFLKDHFDKVALLEAKEADYKRVSLLRGIGHDLKIPISVIKSSYEILGTYSLSEGERKECMEAGRDALSELENMAGNIGSYLKPPGGKEEKASLREAVERAEAHFKLRNSRGGHNFSVEKDGGDFMANADSHQLYRMIFNLVDNAFKYTPSGGSIALALKTGQGAKILVEDTGIGMKEGEVERIFEPFYRADGSRSRDGLGIGLCISREIAERAGAEIGVESKPGKGTQISVNFN